MYSALRKYLTFATYRMFNVHSIIVRNIYGNIACLQIMSYICTLNSNGVKESSAAQKYRVISPHRCNLKKIN